jgi:hypothetical protein
MAPKFKTIFCKTSPKWRQNSKTNFIKLVQNGAKIQNHFLQNQSKMAPKFKTVVLGANFKTVDC